MLFKSSHRNLLKSRTLSCSNALGGSLVPPMPAITGSQPALCAVIKLKTLPGPNHTVYCLSLHFLMLFPLHGAPLPLICLKRCHHLSNSSTTPSEPSPQISLPFLHPLASACAPSRIKLPPSLTQRSLCLCHPACPTAQNMGSRAVSQTSAQPNFCRSDLKHLRVHEPQPN